MRTATRNTANRKIGYLLLALVSSVTAVLVAIGIGAAYLNAPAAGHRCSVPNATTHDAAGRTMWCDPATSGTRGVIWQYAPGS